MILHDYKNHERDMRKRDRNKRIVDEIIGCTFLTVWTVGLLCMIWFLI
jgi:phosphatidylglycerophosphatase A